MGLLTLCYTELIPIRIFGYYSAVGVVVSGALLVFYIPAVLEIWKPKLKLKPTEHHEDESVHEILQVNRGFWWAGEGVLGTIGGFGCMFSGVHRNRVKGLS